MPNREKNCKVSVLLMSCLFLSCAATHAPRGWLERPNDSQTDTFGGWLNLETKTKRKLAGELIAISNDSIFVVTETFDAVALTEIESARLVAYKSNIEDMSGLVAAGTLSTVTNGLLLVGTAPMWILGGSIATGIRSHEPIIDYPRKELSRFAPFARYPQGLPPGIDRGQIEMKPRE